MPSTVRKFSIYDELLALSDNVVGEIIAGELIVSPRPAPRHARASSALGGKIWDPFDQGQGGPGGWWILNEPEIHLADDVVVPDIAGWRRSNLPVLPTDKAYFTVTPNWVCEIISPSTARHDRIEKLTIYAREKVEFVWLVDPSPKTLEIYKLHEEGWILLRSFAGNKKIKAEPFDAIELDLSALWLPDEEKKS